MDNLTHTAIGLFLSRAGMNRWTPKATGILLVAANLPDIDIVTAWGSSLNYLHYHRHLTHSLVAMPVVALVAVLIVRAVSRGPIRWLGAFCAALCGVASHLLLDWTNSYGIRLFLPFSEEWLRLDLNNVVDLWIWAVALLCIVGPVIARLVGSEITSGGARPRYPGRGFAWLALGFVLLYDCGRAVMHTRALAILESRSYQQSTPTRFAALPDAANPLRWRGLVETPDFYTVADINVTGNFDPTRAQIFLKPEPDPVLDIARRTHTFQEFLRFSQFPLWRVSPAPDVENGKLVESMDMRFGSPVAPGFMASAVVSAPGRVLRTWFQWGTIRVK